MASARVLSNAAPASAATAAVAKTKFRIFPSTWAPLAPLGASWLCSAVSHPTLLSQRGYEYRVMDQFILCSSDRQLVQSPFPSLPRRDFSVSGCFGRAASRARSPTTDGNIIKSQFGSRRHSALPTNALGRNAIAATAMTGESSTLNPRCRILWSHSQLSRAPSSGIVSRKVCLQFSSAETSHQAGNDLHRTPTTNLTR